MFCDKTIYHISRRGNKQYLHIWGTEHVHATVEHVRDSPKVNVWCGLLHDHLIGPFFFAETTVTSNSYLDMLENFVCPQVQEL